MPPLNKNGITNIIRYTGEPNVPRNVRKRRESNLRMMRRFGSPVVIKHRYNDEDVHKGLATTSGNFSSTYGQTRREDPLSHGVGFVGKELSENEWVGPKGNLVVSDTDPSTPQVKYTRAPRYRGFGPGYLTYVILPDVSEDVFKITEAGALIRTQQAQAQMGWWPEVNDNDLMIIVEINRNEEVVATRERFALKMTSPASMRGQDRLGRREATEDYGNRHVTDQSFEMTLLPANDVLYRVEVDR